MASNAESGSASSDSGSKGSSGGAGASKSVTDYSIHKSFGGTQNFYSSHGLIMDNSSDYAEGKAIARAFKDADARSKSRGSKSSGSKSRGRASR